jgi:hypothetical protein
MCQRFAGDELGDGAAVVRRMAIVIIGPDSMAASTRSAVMACSASWLGARSTPAS